MRPPTPWPEIWDETLPSHAVPGTFRGATCKYKKGDRIDFRKDHIFRRNAVIETIYLNGAFPLGIPSTTTVILAVRDQNGEEHHIEPKHVID